MTTTTTGQIVRVSNKRHCALRAMITLSGKTCVAPPLPINMPSSPFPGKTNKVSPLGSCTSVFGKRACPARGGRFV